MTTLCYFRQIFKHLELLIHSVPFSRDIPTVALPQTNLSTDRPEKSKTPSALPLLCYTALWKTKIEGISALHLDPCNLPPFKATVTGQVDINKTAAVRVVTYRHRLFPMSPLAACPLHGAGQGSSFPPCKYSFVFNNVMDEQSSSFTVRML